MTEKLHAAKEALRRTRLALRKGDKDVARRWAEKAATLAPELEEAWLFLAATSEPQLSIRYLERALAINPQSEKARKGMAWAKKRVVQQQASTKPSAPVEKPPKKESVERVEKTLPSQAKAPVAGILRTVIQEPNEATQPTSTTTDKAPKRNVWRQSLPATLMTIVVVSAVWALFPRMKSFAAGFKAEPTATLVQEYWGEADIRKPTYTPTATATLTPSPTPTITPSPTATFTPLPTKTPYPTAEPEVQAPAPVYEPAPAGSKYVLVDISEQHMYVYEGNTLVYSFVASTGMNNATATGQFSVLNKIPNAYGSTWDIWMPYWLGIYWAGSLQNGIHALPIMSNGATLWAGYLGSPISYGCVVLGTYDAKVLFDWVDVGTPVEIQW